MGVAVDVELNGLLNVSGSKSADLLKKSGLPPVRVLFPAPFAPAMSVKTGVLTLREQAPRREDGS